MSRIILASASPRRKEILAQAGIDFEVLSAEHEEHSDYQEPEDFVKDLASQKAEAAAAVFEENFGKTAENTIIIGADTVVVLKRQILGKPKDEGEAFTMLSSLQGKSHYVFTGVSVIILSENGSREQLCFAESTRVQVCRMAPEEIRCYIATGEPMDKAGSYAIQGRFAPYIEGIEGDYYNVVGFPLCRFYQEVKNKHILML